MELVYDSLFDKACDDPPSIWPGLQTVSSTGTINAPTILEMISVFAVSPYSAVVIGATMALPEVALLVWPATTMLIGTCVVAV